MSYTKELEILEQLHNFTIQDSKLDIPIEYPLLKPEFVKNIAKSITEIVYNTYERKTLSAKKSRDTILELLKKLTDPNTHLPITDSNVDIIIQYLSNKKITVDENLKTYRQFFLNPGIEESITNDWESICGTISKKYKTNLENKFKLGYLQIWDSVQLQKNGFEFTLLVKNMQNTNIEKSIEYLRSLNKKSDVENVKLNERVDKCDEEVIEKNDDEIEKTKIELTLALLNRENNVERNKLLLLIIEELSRTKTESVIKLVNYIWLNRGRTNLPQEIYTIMFLNFPHLYEKPIILLATYVVESMNSFSDIEEYHKALNTFNVEEILQICKSMSELIINVISVLDSLLKLSSFDTHLLVLINIIFKNYLFYNKE